MGEAMNIQADPVGYKALSRHFAASSRAEAEVASEVRDQGTYIRFGAYAMITLASIAVLWVLHESRAIAMPVVLGIVVGLVLGPIGDKLAPYRIPTPLTVAVLVIGAVMAFVGVVYLVSPSIADFSQAAPRIARSFDRIVKSAEGLFSVLNSFKQQAAETGTLVTETRTSGVDVATKVAGILTPAFSQFMIFFFTLLLFTASRQEIRNAMVMSFTERAHRLAILKSFSKAEERLADYILAISVVNVGLGASVAGIFWLADIPGALVWGVVAFIANFLPVVGPLLLKGALLVFGIATFPSLPMALLPLGLFLIISLIEANAITPRIVGKKMTMSPLMVFLSVVFWTWLWGFAGAFLAMPLLAILSVIRDEFLADSGLRLTP
jgi:predicted PurR-regulated permease PerM